MEKVTFIEVTWEKDNAIYSFKGRTPFYPQDLYPLGINEKDAIEVINCSYYLTCHQKPYHFYTMIFFDSSDYDKIIDKIEPNRFLKFKEYSPNKCKWIYNIYGNH
jgi:hypothetical protein